MSFLSWLAKIVSIYDKKYGKSALDLDVLLVDLGKSALDKINNMDVLQYTYEEKCGVEFL